MVGGGIAVNRKKSRVVFGFGTATAVAVTCIVLYSLTADLSLFQASLFPDLGLGRSFLFL